MDVNNNEEVQSLDKYKDKYNKYDFFPFNTPYLPQCKKLNHLIDLDKELISLNYIIYISSIG